MYNVGVEPTSPALRQVFLPKLKLFYTSVPSERFELSLLAEPGFESSVSTIPPQGHNLKNMANRNRTYFSLRASAGHHDSLGFEPTRPGTIFFKIVQLFSKLSAYERTRTSTFSRTSGP